MQDQIPQPVDGPELVDIPSRDPEHLINGSLFGAISRPLEHLFKLSGREELHVHAMHAAHVLPGTLVEIHRVTILAL